MTSRVEELQRMCDSINENGGLDSGEWHTALLAQIAQNLAVIADVMMADRKTEPSGSEIPNNCEVKNYCDDCLYTDTCDSKEFFYACTSKATISKMEQVDKDINVRSKDEPQTCSVNGRPYDCGNCEYFRCTADEPQTERSE